MLGLQIMFGFFLFVFVALSYLIPVLILRGRIQVYKRTKRSVQDVVSSCCNCASAGVFIAIFFLGLLPNVRNKFETLFRRLDIQTGFPTTECVIVGGYFLTLSAHQCYLMCKNLKLKKTALNNSQEFELKKSLLNEFELDNMIPYSASQDEISLSDSPNSNPPVSVADKSSEMHGENQITAVVTKSKIDKTSHKKHSHMLALTEQASGIHFCVLVMATSVHAVFEGATLALQTTTKKALHLFIAILAHECLVALALGLNTSKLKLPFFSIFKFAIMFSLSLPLGVGLGLALGLTQGVTGLIVSAVVQGIASGTFLHIIFQELIPMEFGSPSNRMLKLTFLLMGFVFFALVTFFLLDH